ncbi:MAG: amidohydrolase family protein [Acidimicrobiia bacterium]
MLLRSVTLADGTAADVRICLTTIDAVAPSLAVQAGEMVLDLTGHLLLPSFVEPHAHLDKAFLAERIENPTGDLMGAILAMQRNRHLLTVDDIAERAERAVRLMAANGVTVIRSHADVTLDNGLRSVEALVRVRERVRHLLDVQIVALTSWPITGAAGASSRALLRDAIAAGVDLVGGCPHLDDDPIEANATFLSLAADAGLPLDLHTDETLDPTALSLEDLALRVRSTGFPHAVTASHCVSLGVQPLSVQRRVADAVAAAGISVVALPHTNLFLLGHDHPVAMPRGLTALGALRTAGVDVAAGADNLQDPFNPMGKGDPLETAALMVLAGHLLPHDALASVTSHARRAVGAAPSRVEPGAPADLVAIPAATIREAIATQPGARLTFRNGELVSHVPAGAAPQPAAVALG